MKTSEIRQKNKEELQEQLLNSEEKLRQMRFNLASGKIKNVKELKGLKKDIARIKTILNEK